jgi:hypothetical protein
MAMTGIAERNPVGGLTSEEPLLFAPGTDIQLSGLNVFCPCRNIKTL